MTCVYLAPAFRVFLGVSMGYGISTVVACSAGSPPPPDIPKAASGGAGSDVAPPPLSAGPPNTASGGTGGTGDALQKLRPIDLVPGQLSDHFPIQSSGNTVTMRRTEKGEFSLRLSAVARKGAEESWAGYCWAVNVVDGRGYQNLRVKLTHVPNPQELQFKLEKKDNRFQDRALRVAVLGDNLIPMGNFPTVQDAIGRFCLVLAAPIGSTTTVDSEVTVAEVWLE